MDKQPINYFRVRLEGLLNLWTYGKAEDKKIIEANKSVVEELVKGYRQFEGQKNCSITHPAYDPTLPVFVETFLLNKY